MWWCVFPDFFECCLQGPFRHESHLPSSNDIFNIAASVLCSYVSTEKLKKTVMFSCYLCFASVARTTTRSFSWPFGKTLYPWHYINPFFTVQCPCVDFKTASLDLHTYLWLIRTKRQMSLWSNRPKSTHAKLFCLSILYLIDVLYSEYFWCIIIIIHLFIE